MNWSNCKQIASHDTAGKAYVIYDIFATGSKCLLIQKGVSKWLNDVLQYYKANGSIKLFANWSSSAAVLLTFGNKKSVYDDKTKIAQNKRKKKAEEFLNKRKKS